MSKGRKVITVFSLVVLILALFFVAYQLFQVREITVEGCHSKTGNDVISLSGIEIDESVFLIDTKAVMESIDNDPYIKPVEVKIEYPDRVHITIHERTQAAYIEKEGLLLTIDEECWLLRVDQNVSHDKAPLVVGLQMDKFEVAKQLGCEDPFQLVVLESVLREIKKHDINITEVNVGTLADIVLRTADGFEIEIGDDTDLKVKFDLARSALNVVKEQGKEGGILDVSQVTKAYYRVN